MTVSISPILFPGLDRDWLEPAKSVFSTLGIVMRLLAILIGAVFNAFSIAAWTLAYADWAEKLPGAKAGRLPEKVGTGNL
jgi:hypothetical protein